MADIRDRLKKLADLVRYDEEARTTCEDAVKELDRLMPAGNAGAIANAAASGSGGTGHSWYRGYTTFSAPPPPSQTTQVKIDLGDQVWIDGKLYTYVIDTSKFPQKRFKPV